MDSPSYNNLLQVFSKNMTLNASEMVSEKNLKIRKKFLNAYIKSLFLGMALTLAFAPFNLIFMVAVSFTLFLNIIERCPNLKAAIKCGFMYGLGYFSTSLYSFSEALFLDGYKFIWMLPLSLFALPAVLSLLFVVPVVIFTYFTNYAILRSLVFGVLWFVFEYIRANFIWPFPWNMLGYTVAGNDILLQSAFLYGLYGCTFLVAVISAVPHSKNYFAIIVALIQVGFMLYYGYSRTNNVQISFYDDVKIRVIQPNLEHHFGNRNLQSIAIEQLGLYSLYKRDKSITHIFWPEASFPYLVEGDENYGQMLKGVAPEEGALVFGADRRVVMPGGSNKYYNSALAINSDGQTLASYDKEILVPFGEYVPMRKLLPFIDKIAYGSDEFSPGFNADKIISLPNFPKFMPLICYEIIFPDIIKNEERPDFLLNVTNESWFGSSLAPDQMFAMARFRAAEYGLSVIRASNHGYSAIIDPYGRVIDYKPIGFAGYLEGKIPKRVNF